MLGVPKYLMNEEVNKVFIPTDQVMVRSIYRNRRYQKILLIELYDDKAIL